MFGLVERGRLALYEKTLSTTKNDAEFAQMYVPGMENALSVLDGAITMASNGAQELGYQDALIDGISSIPSGLLVDVDHILLRIIKPPTRPNDVALYYMASLLNGLVYVRIVEVSHPALRHRAHSFRDAALSFLEPIYRTSLKMMVIKAKVMLSYAQEERAETERQATIDEAVRVGLAASRRYGS